MTRALTIALLFVGMWAIPAGAQRASDRAGHYWDVDATGAVTPGPGAGFFGSVQGSLNQPIVGIAATADGGGYWLVASDGGVFSFGDAAFHGSTGAIVLNAPVVGIAPTPDGGGYWLGARDGGVFSFGDAAFYGSAAGTVLSAPVMSITSDGDGYRLGAGDGTVYRFGAPTPPRPYPSPNPSVQAVLARNLFDADNDERRARGIAQVTWSPDLAASAADWSQDHLPSTGADPPGQESNVIGRGGCPNPDPGPCYATANLPTDGDAHIGWMYSQGHRNNILDPAVTREGVGVYCAPDGILYATEIFSAPAGSAAEPVAPLDPVVHADNSGTTCDGQSRPANDLDHPPPGA